MISSSIHLPFPQPNLRAISVAGSDLPPRFLIGRSPVAMGGAWRSPWGTLDCVLVVMASTAAHEVVAEKKCDKTVAGNAAPLTCQGQSKDKAGNASKLGPASPSEITTSDAPISSGVKESSKDICNSADGSVKLDESEDAEKNSLRGSVKDSSGSAKCSDRASSLSKASGSAKVSD